MTYRIALTFEDGVTRFVSPRPDETIADAAYRERINIPVDCRDGACGTCKSFCETGAFDPGVYIEEALTQAEAAEGYCLPCQMRPTSDCILRIPVSSASCKIQTSEVRGTVQAIDRLSQSTVGLSLDLEGDGLLFLPGQYVHLGIPNSDKARAYSFSSTPGSKRAEFLVRNIPGGAMSTYLTANAQPGDHMPLLGPYGAFYLRSVKRAILMLAGGTGLAPFLSMLGQLVHAPPSHPVHLVYGVTNDADLVKLGHLQTLLSLLPTFTYTTCVAAPESLHPAKGYVTHHLPLPMLQTGEVDVYLCGPPPMVEAVRTEFRRLNIQPASFHYEKFAPSEELKA
jgi:benzoate/toluate 1,2-dioxygenase reductase subunit